MMLPGLTFAADEQQTHFRPLALRDCTESPAIHSITQIDIGDQNGWSRFGEKRQRLLACCCLENLPSSLNQYLANDFAVRNLVIHHHCCSDHGEFALVFTQTALQADAGAQPESDQSMTSENLGPGEASGLKTLFRIG